MRKITNATAARLLKEYDNSKIFHVTFIKRTNGEIREMTCRKGVSKYVKGTAAFDPKQVEEDHHILHVFDVELFNQKCAEAPGKLTEDAKIDIGVTCYRSINLDCIIALRMDGKEYITNNLPVKDFTCQWPDGKLVIQRYIKGRTEQEVRANFKRVSGLDRIPRGLVIRESK
jgi:hypothetical protein